MTVNLRHKVSQLVDDDKMFLVVRAAFMYVILTKPKLLSAEVKNSRVILRIVLPLLAKALYEFGFFGRNFVRIGKTIRRIT